MINLFKISSDDKSVEYLREIFGTMNGIIPGGSGGIEITLLGTMFKLFNSVILAVGVFIVVYVTVVGVIYTAHEGEFLGKKWHNIWIPIRTVLGVAMLVPTGSGYSAIQLVMMWVIIQGIGAADMLWNTVLSYVSLVGSPYGKVTIPSVGAFNTFNELFKGLTLAATAKISAQDPTNSKNGGYFCTGGKSGFCTGSSLTLSAITANTSSVAVGPNGAGGTLTYCNQQQVCTADSNSLQCLACTAQIAALQQIVPTLSDIATQFALLDYAYRDFYYNSSTQPQKSSWGWIYEFCAAQNPPIPKDQCCVTSRVPGQTCKANNGQPGNDSMYDLNGNGYPQNISDEAVKNLYWTYGMKPYLGGNVDFIQSAVGYYVDTVAAAASTYIQALGQTGGSLSGQFSDAAKVGWIFAGSYYYMIAKSNNGNLQNALPPLAYQVQDPNTTVMATHRNNFVAASVLENVAAGNTSFASTAEMNQINGAVNASSASVTQSFTSGTSGVNPISAMQIAGAVMLLVVAILFPILLAISLIAGILGFFNIFSLGTGGTNPAGGTLLLVYFLLVPALFGFMGMLVSLGGTLAIYIPLIPYVIFTFGAIGWLISTIETMVAGPLVALGVLSPSGQHELLGKSEPALMLLFDVFLRPSLMIFGLIAAMLLATVVVGMINEAFWTTVVGGIFVPANTGSTEGQAAVGWVALALNPIELVLFLSAYVSLLVAALNKCFQAIYLIPQGVMKWVSGQAAQYGEEAGVSAAKEGVQAGAGGTKGALQGGSKMGDQAGYAAKKKREESGAGSHGGTTS